MFKNIPVISIRHGQSTFGVDGGGSNIKGGNFGKMGDTEGIILGKYGD